MKITKPVASYTKWADLSLFHREHSDNKRLFTIFMESQSLLLKYLTHFNKIMHIQIMPDMFHSFESQCHLMSSQNV